jgi:hypothetical protein
MSLKSKLKSTYVPAPAGSHTATLIALVDCGLQYSERFDSESERLWIQFELPHERMEDGRPFTIGSFMANSLNEKAGFRKVAEALLGRALKSNELGGLELGPLLGKSCLISITHKEADGKTRAKIDSAMPLPKGTTVGAPHNPLVAYDLDDPDEAVFEKLPEHVRELIEKRIRHGTSKKKAAEPESATADEDIPY